MEPVRVLLLLTLLFASVCSVFAETVSGRVVSIADGDTLTLLTSEQRQVKVRLHGIDAPEKAQPFGTRSRQALGDLAFNKQASVRVENTDRYGRTVGTVTVGGKNVKRGLWADPNPVPPWEWRRGLWGRQARNASGRR